MSDDTRPDETHIRALTRRVLELLDAARKTLRLYPERHPTVTDSFGQLQFALSDLFLAARQLDLAVLDGEFYVNDLPLKRESPEFRELARHLETRAASLISLRPNVTANELRLLMAALEPDPDELRRAGGAAAVIGRLQLENVTVGRAHASGLHGPTSIVEERLPTEVRERLAAARAGYRGAVDTVRQMFLTVAEEGRIDYRTIKSATEALLDSVVTNRNVWSHLLNVKHTDEYSYNHSVNVATLSLLLATRLGVTSEGLSVLGEAALLHDLGKQKVPREILQKPAALTDDEWVEMRSHPEKGAKILLGIRDVSEASIMVAYEHHIRYDHKGYPATRSRRSLHLFSHLVAVADIYDALTSDRGYRAALVPDMAMRIILTQSGTAFHPLVVKHFVNLVGIYPVGTFVRLRTGSIALVQHNQNRDLLRPVVLEVYDGDGRAVRPVTRDLVEEQSAEPPIESCIDPAQLGLDLANL